MCKDSMSRAAQENANRIFASLRDLPGQTVKALVQTTGLGQTTIYRFLNDAIEAGDISRNNRRHYIADGSSEDAKLDFAVMTIDTGQGTRLVKFGNKWRASPAVRCARAPGVGRASISTIYE